VAHDDLAAVRAREAEFHDRLAAQAGVREPSDPDPWESSVLAGAGEVAGLEVLDLGCGDGDLTLHLAAGGARVTGLDLSPGMIEVARQRVERFQPDADARFVTGVAEQTAFADESFDLIVGKWVLHHLDLLPAIEEIRRLLRPGGRGVFVETSGLNPGFRLARRVVHRAGLGPCGTPDEHPITRSDLKLIRDRFKRCEVDFPNFVVLGIFARNVLRFRPRALSVRLWRADARLARRAPFLGPLSYYLRVVVEK
jgi:SAM-dependent methyltransferase